MSSPARESPDKFNQNGIEKGSDGLVRDMKVLQADAAKSGDVKFLLKDGFVKAHTLIIKARCKNWRGSTSYLDIATDTFHAFLTYVYTGKLKADNSLLLFHLCLLATDFGLDDLIVYCEETIVQSLDQTNALLVMEETVEKLETSSSSLSEDMKSTIQRIFDITLGYLSENNPATLKKNPTFLNISTTTMAAFLQSEHLCLEEEEVWRCVLKWAQNRAQVSTNPSKWTEEQRVKVSKYLTPVISLVRLLLIDSRVFAEEVEPTGCVPMALSLERYRHAALATLEPSERAASDPRLTPRNSQRLFQASMIINSERLGLGKRLHEWYKETLKDQAAVSSGWRCVYRASLHGFSAKDFHSRVDGLSPTFVLVLLKNSKWICGGFTDVPWSSPKIPKYFSSSNSFLFSSSPTNLNEPLLFKVTKKHFAVCHDENSGPIFGAGADLYISSMSNTSANSYSNLPHSYEIHEEKAAGMRPLPILAPAYKFVIGDIEVFTPQKHASVA